MPRAKACEDRTFPSQAPSPEKRVKEPKPKPVGRVAHTHG